MKKMVCCALSFLHIGSLYALPVGNPAEASLLTQGIFLAPKCQDTYDPCFTWFDAWSLKAGFYGDYVFNRHLKITGRGNDRVGTNIQTTRLITNAGYLAINICNKAEVFGTLGSTRITAVTDDISWNPLGGFEGRLDWRSAFSWSAGARGTLFQRNRFAIGVEGQFFQTTPHLNDFMSGFDGAFDYFRKGTKMRYREWQGGLGLSYFLSQCCSEITVVPYIAAKWSWARFHTGNFQFVKNSLTQTYTIYNMRSKLFAGAAIGISMSFFNRADVTVEGRFGDEKALHVNGFIRF